MSQPVEYFNGLLGLRHRGEVQLIRGKPTVNFGESCKHFLPLKIAWFQRGFLFLGGIVLATSPADVARGSASVAWDRGLELLCLFLSQVGSSSGVLLAPE